MKSKPGQVTQKPAVQKSAPPASCFWFQVTEQKNPPAGRGFPPAVRIVRWLAPPYGLERGPCNREGRLQHAPPPGAPGWLYGLARLVRKQHVEISGRKHSDAPQSAGAPCTDFPALAPVPALRVSGPRSVGSCLRGRRKMALSGYTDLAVGLVIVAHDDLLIANRCLVHGRNGA